MREATEMVYLLQFQIDFTKWIEIQKGFFLKEIISSSIDLGNSIVYLIS